MGNLTEEIEKEIQEILPEQFGLILDGWTEVREHYVAIFACFPKGAGLQIDNFSSCTDIFSRCILGNFT
jgi:hypothetical protein